MPVRTSPVPAVASEGGPWSEITVRPSGERTIVSAPLEQDDGVEALGAAARSLQPVRVDPVRVSVEQPCELTRVWRQHEWRIPLDRLEAEEPVGVDDHGLSRGAEELVHELTRFVGAPEPRADRDRLRPFEVGRERLERVVPLEAALHRLERQGLGDVQAGRGHGERHVARVRAHGGARAQHRRAMSSPASRRRRAARPS